MRAESLRPVKFLSRLLTAKNQAAVDEELHPAAQQNELLADLAGGLTVVTVAGRAAIRRWRSALEAQLAQIKFIDEHIDDTDRAVLVDPFVPLLRKENIPRSILAFDVSPQRSLPPV